MALAFAPTRTMLPAANRCHDVRLWPLATHMRPVFVRLFSSNHHHPLTYHHSLPTSMPNVDTSTRHTLLETPVGEVIVIPTDEFLSSILPPLPSALPDMETFMATAREQRAPNYRLITQTGILCGYSAMHPSTSSRREAYKPLQDSAKKLVWLHKQLTQKAWFVENTKRYWDLQSRPADAFPDAFLYTEPRTNTRSPIDWSCIAVSGAYHKEKTTRTREEVSRLSVLTAIRPDPRIRPERNQSHQLHD